MKPQHILLLVASQMFWGANFAVIKLGLGSWPPLFFIALRLLAVSLLLIPFVGWPKGREWAALIPASVVLGLFHFATLFIGLTLADAATTALLIQIQVPLSLLLGLFLGELKFVFRHWLGVALAFLGIIFLVGRPQFAGGAIAALLILGAACSWTLVNRLIKRLAETHGARMNGWRLNAWIALLAGPILLGLSFLLEEGQMTALAEASLGGWISLFYQVLIVTALCYGIWYAMLHNYPVNRVMPFTLLEPVFGALAAVLLLGEAWDFRLFLGAGIVLGGLALLIFERRRHATEPLAAALATETPGRGGS